MYSVHTNVLLDVHVYTMYIHCINMYMKLSSADNDWDFADEQ
jgi:hypothetical protein